jgi:hypothetical protein
MRNDMAETLPIADPPAELLAQLAQEKAAYEAALTPTEIDPRFGLSIIPHTPHTKTTGHVVDPKIERLRLPRRQASLAMLPSAI